MHKVSLLKVFAWSLCIEVNCMYPNKVFLIFPNDFFVNTVSIA